MLIIFSLHVSNVFDSVKTFSLETMLWLFINKLNLWRSEKLIKKLANFLKKKKTLLKLRLIDIVI